MPVDGLAYILGHCSLKELNINKTLYVVYFKSIFSQQ